MMSEEIQAFKKLAERVSLMRDGDVMMVPPGLKVEYLGRMEYYDRLKQERDELAAQVEVMLDALNTCHNSSTSMHMYFGIKEVENALTITPPAALREIEARVLEEAATDSGLSEYITATELRAMAAAKRKG